MPWTATLNSVEKLDGNNVATVTLDNGAGEVKAIKIPGNTLATSLPAYIGRLIAEREQRDTDSAGLALGPIVFVKPSINDALEQAKQAARAVIGIQTLKAATTDAAIVTALTNRSTTLQTRIKTYLQANPGTNIEDLF